MSYPIYKIVRMLQIGTTLSAINDDNQDVTGVVEAYHYAEYLHEDGKYTHDVEYLVRWSDGLLEWISWGEVNEYSPVRPPKEVLRKAALHRAALRNGEMILSGAVE